MNFFDAMTTNDILTENAMPTHSTSGNFVLDWFFKMGGARQLDRSEALGLFLAALAEDRALTLRSIFALRNIRGGMGERELFRFVTRWLAQNYPEIVRKNLHNIPHFGRWDDVLFVCLETPVENDALHFVFDALREGDKLCAKWMPREGKRLHRVARGLAKKFDLTAQEYRKLLAGNTEVVENLMCSNRWGMIEFAHVPSVAFKKYRKAFARHEPERFAEFLSQVEEGKAKVHASAIFPHDIIREYVRGIRRVDRAAEAQWASLPDYGAPSGTLVVSDVSGSMNGEPMEVSVALGIYFAERLEGEFKNLLVTFSARPTFFNLPEGSIADKVYAVKRMNWDMNTNLEAVFQLVLNQAVKHGLPQEQMPGTILIISDMQFDRCIQNGNANALQMMRGMYSDAGYEMPQVIFWNVRSSFGVPAKVDESGVALLSGYSPALMKATLSGASTPMGIMLQTLNNPMYDRVVTD